MSTPRTKTFALHYTGRRSWGLTEIVGLLMERGADPLITDSVGGTALRYAVR